MSAVDAPLTAAGWRPRASAGARRLRALCRGELTLFWRSRTVVFNALLLPVMMMVLFTRALRQSSLPGQDGLVTAVVVGAVLIFCVYANLVIIFVSRRETLVLKRLRVGELTDGELLAGVASPTVLVALAQCALAVLVGRAVLGLPWPAHPVLLLAGFGSGIAIFVLLAAVTTPAVRTTEAAQLASLPVILLSTTGSVLTAIVADRAPGLTAAVQAILPLSAVADLVRLGWLGDGDAGLLAVCRAAAVPAAASAGWMLAGTLACRRWFRWEPRR